MRSFAISTQLALLSAMGVMAQDLASFQSVGAGGGQIIASASDATGILVAGLTAPNAGVPTESEAFVRKHDREGNVLWSRKIDGRVWPSAMAAHGGITYVTGYNAPSLSAFPIPEAPSGAFVSGYGANGTQLWRRVIVERNESPYSIAADDSGIYLVTNRFASPPADFPGARVRKLDFTGAVRWTVDLPRSRGLGAGVAADNRGSLYVVSVYSVQRYSAEGEEQWTRPLGGESWGLPQVNAAESGIYVLFKPTSDFRSFDRFLRKYDVGGNELWTRDLGGLAFDDISASAVDDAGIYVAGSARGWTRSGCIAGRTDVLLARFDGQGGNFWTTRFGTVGVDRVAGVGLAEDGVVLLVQSFQAGGTDQWMAKVEKSSPRDPMVPQIRSGCVVNAASYEGGGVAPGEIVAIIGAQLGPSEPARAAAGEALPTTLGGTRVLFGGTPAQLLYASATQVNALVPAELSGSKVEMKLEYNGGRSRSVSVPVLRSRPGFFSASGVGQGAAAAWNEDGSANSDANPARPGSLVSLFLTGFGLEAEERAMEFYFLTGPFPIDDNTDFIGARIVSARSVPQLPGVTQLTVRLPELGPGRYHFYFREGQERSDVSAENDVTISIQ